MNPIHSPSSTRARQIAAALVGQTLSDRYRVDEIIAMGGIGAVYRGEHVHLEKQVAIKLLRPDAEGYPELVARFEREAVAGALIDHPNVASATDFGRLEDGSCFLVLEYVPGISLREMLGKRRLAPIRAAQIARQIAAGLDACHKKGVVHRDIKPRNVMIELETSRAVLIDFGLARVPTRRARTTPRPDDDDETTAREITLKGFVFGTIAYMAPETAHGMDAVDERSDLYALGLVFYEMLAGVHPFDADDPAHLFMSQRATIPPPVAVRAPGARVPAAIEAIVMRLLQKNPADRYPNAAAVIDAIDRAVLSGAADADATPIAGVHALSLPDEQEVGARPRAGRWTTRASWLVGLAAAVAAAVLAVRTASRDRVPPPAPVRSFAAVAIGRGERVTEHTRAVLDHAARAAARERMRSAARGKEWPELLDAFLAVAARDPDAFDDHELASAAEAVAMRAALENDSRVNDVFRALAEETGPAGVGVLYDMATTRGGSRGAKRASDALRRDDVRARAPAGVAVAMALRTTRCEDKRQLFERAAAEGDSRALLELERLRSPTYCAEAGSCCYIGSHSLETAIRSLKTRLGVGASAN